MSGGVFPSGSGGSGSIRSLPGRADPGLLSEGEVAAGQALAIALLLVLLDLSQHGAQALVGHDGSLLDAGVLVEEDAAGEPLPRVADLDAPVLVLVNAASLT
jgi:hypothetical protein